MEVTKNFNTCMYFYKSGNVKTDEDEEEAEIASFHPHSNSSRKKSETKSPKRIVRRFRFQDFLASQSELQEKSPESEPKINFDFKGIYLSLPERCSHCSLKLNLWKGVESDHTYCCLYCSYVEGECCEGLQESHFKYHYHPMYKIPNQKLIDSLNGLYDLSEIH